MAVGKVSIFLKARECRGAGVPDTVQWVGAVAFGLLPPRECFDLLLLFFCVFSLLLASACLSVVMLKERRELDRIFLAPFFFSWSVQYSIPSMPKGQLADEE